MKFKLVYYICLIFCFNTSVGYAFEDHPEDLVQQCNSEIKDSSFNGACLRLGIVAKKIKHDDLYNKMESLCVEHFQRHQSSADGPLRALLEYYPQCLYVFKGANSMGSKNKSFNSGAELKTLVRFLNNTYLE